MDVFSIKIFLYLIIVLSAVFHEYAHSWVAYRLGDMTAKNAGRLTLNPLVHLDLFGTVIMPLFLLFTSGIFLGWAKPVPYNPFNLRDKKYGTLKVGIAGPSANLLIALFFGLFLRFFSGYFLAAAILPPIFIQFLGLIIYINIFLALFNLLPFPPLDGSKVFATLFPRQWRSFSRLGFMGIFLALFIAFFILSPIAQFIFWLITGVGFSF
ncbi:MAG TPA: site-2 protease family protein [Candidatus Wolfebacteria bacterium]|nr:site-2 protease family protein [Candidatus Wolfebacteria bacterium]